MTQRSSGYGVIRALEQMRRYADPCVEPSLRLRAVERGAQALDLLSELLEVLPDGRQAAIVFASVYARRLEDEGMTDEVRKLRDAARQIERVLDACRNHALSADHEAVLQATALLRALVSVVTGLSAEVRPGDCMSTHFLGAMAVASYPNGARWELSLRRAHPEYDVDTPEGVWLLEGGGFMAGGSTQCVEIELGTTLPPDIRCTIGAQIADLHRNSSARLRVLKTA